MENQEKIFSPAEAAIISESVKQSTNAVEGKLKNINWLMWAIISILVLGFITMFLMVAGLVLDAWRFKSNSYEGLVETIRTQDKIINDNKTQQTEFKGLLESIQKDLQKNNDSVKK